MMIGNKVMSACVVGAATPPTSSPHTSFGISEHHVQRTAQRAISMLGSHRAHNRETGLAQLIELVRHCCEYRSSGTPELEHAL